MATKYSNNMGTHAQIEEENRLLGSPRNRFRNDALLLLVGNAVSTASQWVVLVLLTKNVTSAEVGYFTLALSISAPVVMFSNLQLRALLSTAVAADTDTLSAYFRLRSMTSALALAFLFLIALIVPNFSLIQRGVLLVIAVAKWIESLSDIRLGLFQQRGRFDIVARSYALRGVVVIVGTSLTLTFGAGIIGAALVMVAAQIATFLAVERRASNRAAISRRHVERGAMKRLSRLALPLGATALFVSAQTSIPRLILERLESASVLGVYAALSYPWALGSLMVQSSSGAAGARYRYCLSVGDLHAFKLQVLKVLFLCVGISGVGLLGASYFGETALRLAYTPEYAKHSGEFLLIGVSACTGYVAAVARQALVALRRTGQQFAVSLVFTAASFVLTYVMVLQWGLRGAAQAAIVVGSLQAITTVAILFRAIPRARGMVR